MFIIKHKKIFIGVSIGLVALSLVSLFVFGLKAGIDFKGGALTEVAYKNSRPDITEFFNLNLENLGFGSISVQQTGDKGLIVKSRDLTEAEHSLLLERLSQGGKSPLDEVSFNS